MKCNEFVSKVIKLKKCNLTKCYKWNECIKGNKTLKKTCNKMYCYKLLQIVFEMLYNRTLKNCVSNVI